MNGHAATAEAAPLVLALLWALVGAWIIHREEGHTRLLGWALVFVACMCLLIACLALPYVAAGM
jgi:hypothetical protein